MTAAEILKGRIETSFSGHAGPEDRSAAPDVIRGRAWHRLDDVLALLARDAAEANSRGEPFQLAVTISGGGATGTYQAGIIKACLQAVEQEKYAALRPLLRPRIVVGTSAGALNTAAFLFEAVHARPGASGPRSDGTWAERLWRTVDAGFAGSLYVAGWRGHAIIQVVTRFLRRRWISRTRWLFAFAALWVLALAINAPFLVALVLHHVTPETGSRILYALDHHPFLLALWPLAVLGALSMAIVSTFRDSLFPNIALRRTLSNAALLPELGGGGGAQEEDFEALQRLLTEGDPATEGRAGDEVVRQWLSRSATTDEVPDFIFTATNLQTADTTLFALAREQTVLNLAQTGWHVHRFQAAESDSTLLRNLEPGVPGTLLVDGEVHIDAGWIQSAELIPCIVASTSAPTVFPAQRIAVRYFGVPDARHFDFVDGGVLRNEPVHVAADAGATHIISIEVDPPGVPNSLALAVSPETVQPHLLANAARTLHTLLRASETRDITQASSWNRSVLRQQLSRREPANAGEGDRTDEAVDSPAREVAGSDKRLVEIFRVAPPRRIVGALDFDGVYQDGRGPSPSLTEWMEQGYDDTRRLPLFWHATLEAAPTPNNQDSCRSCHVLERLRARERNGEPETTGLEMAPSSSPQRIETTTSATARLSRQAR
jgi:predicted acylesterase/phospholipase RssA